MAYQVIARKWRPQQFEDVVGQGAITRALSNALRTGRLHHAYLFAGPRGVGKTTCARLFARALNCVEGPTPTPCGACPSCQETLTGNSLDVLEIDAASHTGVDNIREVIIATVGNRPARDRYKVFIIDEVHMLSTSSFNALLKTLEEPPPHVVFIMATTELHKLPETILSRCQVYEFRTVGVDVIADRLRQIAEAEQVPISRAALVQIAHAGRGSLRDAQSALEQVLAFAGTSTEIDEAAVRDALGLIGIGWLSEVVEAIHKSDAAAVLLDVERLVRTGHDLRQFLRELMTYLRHLLVAQLAGADRELLPVAESEVAVIKKQSQYFTVAELIRLFSLVADLEMQIRAAEDPRPLVEVGLVKLTQLGHLKPLEDILARLDTLLAEGLRPLPVSSPAAATTGKRPSTTARPTPPLPSGPRPERPTRTESGPPDRQPLRLAPPPETPPPEPPLDAALLSAAPPADDSFDPTNAHDVLARIKQRAEQEKPFLATQLDRVQSARWDGDRFELSFGPEAKSHEASVREARAFLQEVLQALTGRQVSLVTRLEGSQPPVASEPAPNRREKPLRAEAERHPAVKDLQRLFGAELFDINPPE